MLKSIIMKNVATYDNVGVEFKDLNRVNLIFGPNGTGKTTISNYLRHYSRNRASGESIPNKFIGCDVRWDVDSTPKIIVYNREFKKENISLTKIPGVFVMGKRAVDNRAKIQALEDELRTIKTEIDKLALSLKEAESSYLHGGKIYQAWLAPIDEQLSKDANEIFPKALDGLKRDHNKRIQRILDVYNRISSSVPLSEEEIRRNISIINERDTEPLREITLPDYSSLISIEASQLWEKVIIGSGDIDFASFINNLSLSDWVRQGVEKIQDTNGICPFCQQHTITSDIVDKFNGYFDDGYKEDVSTVVQLVKDYKKVFDSLISHLSALLNENTYSEFIDFLKFIKIIKGLQNHQKTNLTMMAKKENSPSDKVLIDKGTMLYESLEDFIVSINEAISQRNTLISQKNKLKSKLPENVWDFLVAKYSKGIELYRRERNNVETRVKEIRKEHSNRIEEEREIKKNISELRAQSSDSTAVIERINKVLERLQFNSFKIESYDSSSYRIVRKNGENASQTLSEGEETLISFLYYIQLLNGSTDANKSNGDIIAVIDDPISSLDNSILSFVAREIKTLMYRAGDNYDNVKQVIILTHNINFHKTLAKSPVGFDKNKTKKTFFVLEKDFHTHSTVIKSQDFNDNIESEYNELWHILKRACEKISSCPNDAENKDYKYTIQNTMRRIYETFFENTCALSNKDIAKMFLEDGNDQEADDFRNLVEWLNEGSHCADMNDFKDLPSVEVIQKYLTIFEKTFKITGNHGQYIRLIRQ